jgi:hypothetical protein
MNEMKAVKTAELLDAALNWAVAKCEGEKYEPTVTYSGIGMEFPATRYSTDPDQAFPIIEREGIATRKHSGGKWYAMKSADLGDGTIARWDEMTVRGGERYGPQSYAVRKRRQRFVGSTLLVAAMRCYVASKLGEEVEVPADLLGE